MGLDPSFSLNNILCFLEFLHVNSLSPRVIKNYLVSLRTMAKFDKLSAEDLYFHSVTLYLRSLTINSKFRPVPRDTFDIPTLLLISQACESLSDPPLYRAAFLLDFFGFLRMSTIAPHSIQKFDYFRHLNRQDVIFATPGAHILLKWTKTLQDRVGHHVVQIPHQDHPLLCPILALKNLLNSRPLSPSFPLFASNQHPFHPVIDTHIRDVLRSITVSLNLDPVAYGFHAFRRSGATLAFD